MAEQQLGAGANRRGISYPGISLKDAVLRAKQFWEQESRHPAPLGSAAKAWGYSEKSSGVRIVVAAQLAFGLMKDLGSGEDRHVQLTDRGLDLVLASEDQPVALAQALRSPKIYADLLGRWPEGLPSDNTIRVYLIKEKGFNPKAVTGFLKDFRDSVGYAGPNSPLRPEVSDGDESLNDGGGSGDAPALPMAGADSRGFAADVVAGGRVETAPIGMKRDVFSLEEGPAVLQWPERLSVESVEDLEAWLALVIKRVKRSTVS